MHVHDRVKYNIVESYDLILKHAFYPLYNGPLPLSTNNSQEFFLCDFSLMGM